MKKQFQDCHLKRIHHLPMKEESLMQVYHERYNMKKFYPDYYKVHNFFHNQQKELHNRPLIQEYLESPDINRQENNKT